MKTIANNSKEMRETMRNISRMINRYETANKAQDKARNNRQYDACRKEMTEAYLAIVTQMGHILKNVDLMGHFCDALDIRNYLDIVEKEFKYTI